MFIDNIWIINFEEIMNFDDLWILFADIMPQMERFQIRGWWQHKRLHSELPPRSQHSAKFSEYKSCESGGIL